VQDEQLTAVTTCSISSARQRFSLTHPEKQIHLQRASSHSPPPQHVAYSVPTHSPPLALPTNPSTPFQIPPAIPAPDPTPPHPTHTSIPPSSPQSLPAPLQLLHLPLHCNTTLSSLSPLPHIVPSSGRKVGHRIVSQHYLSFPSTAQQHRTVLRFSKPRVRGSAFSRHWPARRLVRSD
jgi:hypothetical protein